MRKIYLSTLVKNWIVWGVAQFVNLKYVPIKVCCFHYHSAPSKFFLVIAVPRSVCEHSGTVLECMSNPSPAMMNILIFNYPAAARARV